MIYDSSLVQTWLSPANLQSFSNAVHQKGAPLNNCWGFIDGTVRPICRPGQNQRVLYNGHKRVHAIKFQSVVTPDGMIANLHGPVEGKRHDSGMLADLVSFNNSHSILIQLQDNHSVFMGTLHIHLELTYRHHSRVQD